MPKMADLETTPDPVPGWALKDLITRLEGEVKTLMARNADLSTQCEELRASKPISAYERQEILRITQEHRGLNDTQNAIVIWLRENRQKEISEGQHTGRGLASVVIGYLQRGLALEKEKQQHGNQQAN